MVTTIDFHHLPHEQGHKIYKQLQAWEREKQQLLNDIERLRESERLVHDLRTAIFEQLREVQEAVDSPDKEFELKESWLRLSREEIQERKRQEFTVLVSGGRSDGKVCFPA
jgi:hypothetical protein